MAVIKMKPTSPGQRGMVKISRNKPPIIAGQRRSQIPIADSADRGSVQQSFCDASSSASPVGSSSHGIAETSILCDVSRMALLSHFPGIAK